MQQVVQVIKDLTETLNQTDYWAAAATIISAVTSIVAIIISIHTARKQNKIAMFEKRYTVYQRIHQIFEISKAISHAQLLHGKVINNNDNENAVICLLTWVDYKKNLTTRFDDIFLGMMKQNGKVILVDKNPNQNYQTRTIMMSELFDDSMYLEQFSLLFSAKYVDEIKELNKLYSRFVNKLILFYDTNECDGLIECRNEFRNLLQRIEEKHMMQKLKKNIKIIR